MCWWIWNFLIEKHLPILNLNLASKYFKKSMNFWKSRNLHPWFYDPVCYPAGSFKEKLLTCPMWRSVNQEIGSHHRLKKLAKSQKRQLWGFGDQRGMTQITWDQVRGGHFGPIYPLFDYFWNLKKLTRPNKYVPLLIYKSAKMKMQIKTAIFNRLNVHSTGIYCKSTECSFRIWNSWKGHSHGTLRLDWHLEALLL